MTCPNANQLAQLGDGTLAEPDRERIEAHLDGCDACGNLLAEIAWSTAVDAPPGFRIIACTRDDRYAARDSDDRLVELRVADDNVAALVGHDIPHVLPVLAVERSRNAVWAATPQTTTPHAMGLDAWRTLLVALHELHRRGHVLGALSRDNIRLDMQGELRLDPVCTKRAQSHYLAPERLHGGPPSRGADQFALCVALWELLVGEPPYSGATPGALAVVMQAPPRMPSNHDARVLRALARGLAFDPTQRWPDCSAVAHALRPSRKRAVIVAAAFVVALAVALVTIFARCAS